MLKIFKLKVEHGVFFSGDLGTFFSGAEQASAQQRAEARRLQGTARGACGGSAAERALGRVRPRGMARGCVRRLRGGASAGHEARRRRHSARIGQRAGRRRRVGNREG